MTFDEAKAKIEKEFIDRYYEFLEDVNTMDLMDLSRNGFGWKYGILGGENFKALHGKDTQKNMLWFQTHIFSGRWSYAWEEAGYDRKMIWALHRDGFLSLQYYTNGRARATGKTDFYYINQANAKVIYKKYKQK